MYCCYVVGDTRAPRVVFAVADAEFDTCRAMTGVTTVNIAGFGLSGTFSIQWSTRYCGSVLDATCPRLTGMSTAACAGVVGEHVDVVPALEESHGCFGLCTCTRMTCIRGEK